MLKNIHNPNLLRSIATRKLSKRKAFGVVEMIVSLILIGTLMASTIPLIGLLNAQQAQSNREMIDRQIALNLVEVLQAVPVNQIQTQAQLDELTKSVDPKSQHQIEIKAWEPDDLNRIRFDIAIVESGNVQSKPTRLSTWRTLSGGTNE
ncbi:MAG TPA: hypothetical protein DD473_13335 [Planctomycetaceae bacterium]|nr:hypothetical protein [Planctomycetaceae bacterium]|tara:strand:- start:1026 stop:1472 length:447 start_codon:yes stop_codon:yes gene_type:complete